MELEQQLPMTVWCGGKNEDQDVSIRLVPNGIDQQQETNLRSREPLAVFKVHSTQLKKHSKYFQACLSERWTGPDAPASMEFNLELIHGTQVTTYTDCFSRLYTPRSRNFKPFKDVQCSLELLRVASQIEFSDLVKYVCKYLSTIPWSDEDELNIRQFSSSPDFPRTEAKAVLVRLKIGKHCNDDVRKNLLSEQIADIIRIALRQYACANRESFLHARSLFEDLFSNIRRSEIDSAFENDVVKIVSKEVKEMLETFHDDCGNHANFHDGDGETVVDIDAERVSDFRPKLKSLCWALELLLKTQVAEEVIKSLVNSELFVPIVTAAQAMDSRRPASKNVALRFCKLVILIFQEVVAGRLLLGVADRSSLVEEWQGIDGIHDQDTQNDILVTWGFRQALEDAFLTLPLQEQLQLLGRSVIFPPAFISRGSLVTLMRRNWPAEGDGVVPADVEVEGSASDSETGSESDSESDCMET